jgi:hypothetical protein
VRGDPVLNAEHTFEHIPDDVFGDAGAPGSFVTTDGSEDSSSSHHRSCQPPVDSTLHPDRHGNCTNVVALAEEIHNSPVALPDLYLFFSQRSQFGSSKSTAEQDRDHSDIPDVTKSFTVRFLKEQLSLLVVEPVSRPGAELLDAFDTSNPGSEFRAQQA